MIESKLKANNCNRGQLFRPCLTSDGTQIQILANWAMSHAKRVTRDNWKNPEYHVIAAIR